MNTSGHSFLVFLRCCDWPNVSPCVLVHDSPSALAWVALLHASVAVPTTRAIYRLTLTHFRSPSFALLTALLSLLPASPVTLYFAPYAEPMFTFLSYRGVCTPLYQSLYLLFSVLSLTYFRDARLRARGPPPCHVVLHGRSCLPVKRSPACTLRPLVTVSRSLSLVFHPSVPKCIVCCLLPRVISALAVTASPTQRLPHLLPCYKLRPSTILV
jgi:hypothetical protein